MAAPVVVADLTRVKACLSHEDDHLVAVLQLAKTWLNNATKQTQNHLSYKIICHFF